MRPYSLHILKRQHLDFGKLYSSRHLSPSCLSSPLPLSAYLPLSPSLLLWLCFPLPAHQWKDSVLIDASASKRFNRRLVARFEEKSSDTRSLLLNDYFAYCHKNISITLPGTNGTHQDTAESLGMLHCPARRMNWYLSKLIKMLLWCQDSCETVSGKSNYADWETSLKCLSLSEISKWNFTNIYCCPPFSSVANGQPRSQQGPFKGCLSMKTSMVLAMQGETEGHAEQSWLPPWSQADYAEHILVAMLMGKHYISLFKIFQHELGSVEGLLHHMAFGKSWWLLSIYTSSASTWPLSWGEDAFASYKVVPFAWQTSWDSIRIYKSQTASGSIKVKTSWPYPQYVQVRTPATSHCSIAVPQCQEGDTESKDLD